LVVTLAFDELEQVGVDAVLLVVQMPWEPPF